MSYKEALNYFELNDLYTEKELKDKYYKLVKTSHPDINNSIDEGKIKKINAMYSILLNELKKRKLRDYIKDFSLNINKLKEKYKETEIFNLCLLYEKKLKKINSILNCEELKNEFNKEVYRLKKELIVPIEKENLLSDFSKYLDGYSLEIKELVNTYINLLKKSETLEELNSLNQKFKLLIKQELKNEKNRIKELNDLKESLKKSQIYYFYLNTKYMSIDSIIMFHYLLMGVLNLINLINFENKYDVAKLLDDIKYDNLELNINKFKDYYLEKYKELKINEFDINKLIIFDDSKKDMEDHELIDKILDKYYLYATSKKQSIEKIINDNDYFNDVFNLIKNISEVNKNKIINYLDDKSYKNIRVLLTSFDDFLDPSKLYISRLNGNLCVIKNNSKKIYTVYLNGKIDTDLTTEADIKWKYMPLLQFFKLCEYSSGLEINEVNYKDTITLNDYNTNYLYFTNELLLCLIDDGETKEFRFITSLLDYKFVKGESDQITRNSYFDYYKDKDVCLADLLLYINNKEIKNHEKSL